MLRIGAQEQAGPPEAPPEEAQEPEAPPDVSSEPDADDLGNSGTVQKVPQQLAGYMGSEAGPFECQGCVFFSQPNACQVVDGDIDPQGCCNNFTPLKHIGGGGDEAMEAPEQEVTEQPEAPPEEEEVPQGA